MKKKTYLLIILISIIFSLYTIEAYLSYLAHSESYLTRIKTFKEKTGKDYDTRSIIEIFNEKKKYEKMAIRYLPRILVNNNNYNLFPLSGISNTKTIHCNESGYYSIYTSDRYGFNNPDEVWNERNIEYILVGDSSLHGACVNAPNDISSILRNISHKSVLNLGYRGNGPLIEYSTLREYFKEGTKNIIWFYSEGDLKDLKDELNNKILLRYLNENLFTQNLISSQNYINDIVRKLILETANDEVKTVISVNEKMARNNKENIRIDKKSLSIKYKVLKFIRLNYTKNFAKNYYRNFTSLNNPQNKKLPYDEFREIIKKANNLALKNNCKFYFVYSPRMNRYKLNFDDTSYKNVKKIVKDLDIPFIDIHAEVLKKEDNPLKLFANVEVETHYTVEGYKKVTEAVFKFISNKKTLY